MNEPPEIDEPVELSRYAERWPAQFESENAAEYAAMVRRAADYFSSTTIVR